MGIIQKRLDFLVAHNRNDVSSSSRGTWAAGATNRSSSIIAFWQKSYQEGIGRVILHVSEEYKRSHQTTMVRPGFWKLGWIYNAPKWLVFWEFNASFQLCQMGLSLQASLNSFAVNCNPALARALQAKDVNGLQILLDGGIAALTDYIITGYSCYRLAGSSWRINCEPLTEVSNLDLGSMRVKGLMNIKDCCERMPFAQQPMLS